MATLSSVVATLETLSDRELRLAATVIRQILGDRKALQDEATEPKFDSASSTPPPVGRG